MNNTNFLQLKTETHLSVLDGWRGISILFVLAAHLLPLSPKSWHFNVSTGILGMVIFFILSGYLITSFLIKNQDLFVFAIRRACRIIPLSWLYLAVALTISSATFDTWTSHFLFYANLPPKNLMLLTDHFWSLCVEVQFYIGVTILVFLFGKRGLLILPALALLFTSLRVFHHVTASSITFYRIDEILAGCTLALIYHGKFRNHFFVGIKKLPITPVFILLVISCMPQGQWLNYFRPYLAATLIGLTLLNPDSILSKMLNNKFLIYCAGISYSLYVIHPLLAESWLGSGDRFEKYAKRPLLFIVLFIIAHLSTRYFEKWFITIGKKLSS